MYKRRVVIKYSAELKRFVICTAYNHDFEWTIWNVWTANGKPKTFPYYGLAEEEMKAWGWLENWKEVAKNQG